MPLTQRVSLAVSPDSPILEPMFDIAFDDQLYQRLSQLAPPPGDNSSPL